MPYKHKPGSLGSYKSKPMISDNDRIMGQIAIYNSIQDQIPNARRQWQSIVDDNPRAAGGGHAGRIHSRQEISEDGWLLGFGGYNHDRPHNVPDHDQMDILDMNDKIVVEKVKAKIALNEIYEKTKEDRKKKREERKKKDEL